MFCGGAEDKVWCGANEGPGHGCLDLGQVLPQWTIAETGMPEECPVLWPIVPGQRFFFIFFLWMYNHIVLHF